MEITSLRPQSLDELIGQQTIKKKLRIAMGASLQREEPLPHVLLTSNGGGLGKSTLATIISSGGSLARALELLESESRNRTMRRTLAKVRASLDEVKASITTPPFPRVRLTPLDPFVVKSIFSPGFVLNAQSTLHNVRPLQCVLTALTKRFFVA